MWPTNRFWRRENAAKYSDFTDRAKKVMLLAEEEARKLNHEYIGTEHILLGLVAGDSGLTASLLRTLGVTAVAIRTGVEAYVQHGPAPVSAQSLPLTPRSKRVIELARDEARGVSQKQVDTEHLLLAQLREPDGVASHVLCALGVKPDELRAEALNVRIQLMKVVEHVVRPMHAGTSRKRKMREELLAHLTAVYEQELTRLHDSAAACEEAARRFGPPAELTSELQSALPYHERISHFVERWARYRAPESAVGYSLRMATRMFVLLLVVLGLATGSELLRFGWIEELQAVGRVFTAILLLTPLLQFVVILAFIKMRDAMWGAFGSRKSPALVLLFYTVIAVAAELYLMGVAAVARWDLSTALEAARFGGAISVIAAITIATLAHLTGQETIRDTQWDLLDIAD